MKAKKPKRRYYTPQEITRDIDKAKERLRHHLAVADALDVEADMLYKAGPKFSVEASMKRNEAEKNRKSAYRLENKRIPFLSQKLAEFQTIPLSGVIPDPSISTKG